MASSKVIILTGASRGIGLAAAHYLLRNSHKLVVVARTAGPLEELKNQYPGQVATITADLSDFSTADKIISLALSSFSRIDGLILNHGVLAAVTRIADSSPEQWRSVFDINFFSLIALVRSALPSLRSNNGRVVLVSSGAATGAYSTWGAYGSSKAAVNHLALTLKVEEPKVITVAVRPGVVDTGMQQAIREEHRQMMDEKDAAKFSGLHADGKLLKPEQPGNVICRLALNATKDLSGKFISWDSAELKDYQD